MSTTPTPRVEAVRRFNRFYTRQVGALEEGLLKSPYSLAEARVLYELAHHEHTTASELSQELRLDAGYLSRVIKALESKDLVVRSRSERDGRSHDLSLSDQGHEAFARLNESSKREIGALLTSLSDDEQMRLLEAMRTIETILRAEPERRVPYILRPPQPGDLGWIVQRHGVLYSQEYGWDERFEGLVAEVVSHFSKHFDPARERCWIAERDGENVGAVMLVAHPDRAGTARLRLLLVEPSARGLGVGRRLVQECARFARRVGYHTITLWTNSVLTAARRIYETEGYQLVASEPHHSFGHDLIGETWELAL